jgi:DNA-binding MarR family transcriptional regulator
MTTASTLPPSTLDRIAIELADHTPAARLLYIRLYAATVHDRPALSESELRDRLRLSGSTVHSQLRALEAAGWLSRRDDPQDPRKTLYEPARMPADPPANTLDTAEKRQ